MHSLMYGVEADWRRNRYLKRAWQESLGENAELIRSGLPTAGTATLHTKLSRLLPVAPFAAPSFPCVKSGGAAQLIECVRL
jgi:hypothetical protein